MSVLDDGPSSYWRLGETSGTTAGDQKTANTGTYIRSPPLGQTSLLTSDTQNRAVGSTARTTACACRPRRRST